MKYNLFKILVFSVFTIFIIFLLSVLFTPIIYNKGQALLSIIHNKEVFFALSLSLITSLISITIATIIGLPVAYVLARYDFKGKRLFDVLVDLPIILPPLVTGMSLLILLGPVLGNWLGKLGLNFVFTPLGIIMAQLVVAAPFAIRSFKTAFAGIDPTFEKAAMTLGDHHFMVFRRITLPLAKNGIITGITMAWARAVGEFGATVMLAGATRFKTETLPIAIYLNIATGNIDLAIAIALIMIIFSIIVLTVIKIFDKDLYNYYEKERGD
ncbi:molybdate ABC transporter permease subunit [Iocasia frigidifontis]|uniref:Molybdenum transport system permease n=1 Tax=Iocasia fonsfrigidae TaxID=2682810 RepID=A0A8A7K5S2_9FIRM|nr:ABC transporter permease [Iocasia fonsfrigidae]MTI59880.1 molybdate ABC transporter permease subunit [Bacillota bacterium]QTL97123.1 molybdate ABC transporter permease subunit [Iocasia fonsfrigidae]